MTEAPRAQRVETVGPHGPVFCLKGTAGPLVRTRRPSRPRASDRNDFARRDRTQRVSCCLDHAQRWWWSYVRCVSAPSP